MLPCQQARKARTSSGTEASETIRTRPDTVQVQY